MIHVMKEYEINGFSVSKLVGFFGFLINDAKINAMFTLMKRFMDAWNFPD